MNHIDTDPLVLFLQKEAEHHRHHTPPLTVIISARGMLDDNLDELEKDKQPKRLTTPLVNERQSHPMVIGHGVGVTESSHRQARKEEHEFMEDNFPDFEGTKAVRSKYDRKDHNYDMGAVDRILDTKGDPNLDPK